MTNAFCASVNFDAFTPNLLAQPRMSTAENSSREWSSFQVAEHSLYEPVEMVPENKEAFRRILANLRAQYSFNPEIFADTQQADAA
jgi:hypothetical protein